MSIRRAAGVGADFTPDRAAGVEAVDGGEGFLLCPRRRSHNRGNKMYHRQFFDFTDTGTQAINGPNFSGSVEQYRWISTGGDTGGTLAIGLYPRAGDTGDGFLFVNHGLAPQLTKAPRQPQHGSDGAADPADTGAAFGVPVVAAGDRLRAVKTGATGTGRLYVWTKQ